MDRGEVLQRIRNGELPVRIADEFGVQKSAISMAFANDPEYKKAREEGMAVLLEMGEIGIEEAGDDLNLARVREILQKRREWRAEREFPQRWGQKQEVTLKADYAQVLDKLASVEIEGEADRVADMPNGALLQDHSGGESEK